MKRKYFILIIILGILISVVGGIDMGVSLAKYESSIDVYVTTETGDIICTVDVDNPGTYYSSDGWAYFKVTIKNYDDMGNITKVPFAYYLTVENKDGYEGYFRYLDASGYSNEFTQNLKGLTYTFGATSEEEQVINIEVKNDTGESEEIAFSLNVYCNQVED